MEIVNLFELDDETVMHVLSSADADALLEYQEQIENSDNPKSEILYEYLQEEIQSRVCELYIPDELCIKTRQDILNLIETETDENILSIYKALFEGYDAECIKRGLI